MLPLIQFSIVCSVQAKVLIRNGRNGYSIKLDEKKIAEKVINYLSINNVAGDYKKTVNNYDWENIANELVEVYSL